MEDRVVSELIEIKCHQASMQASLDANTKAIMNLSEEFKPVRTHLTIFNVVKSSLKFLLSSSALVYIVTLLMAKHS